MKFAISNFEIILISNAGVRAISLDHPFYVEICRALQAGEDEVVLKLIDAKKVIADNIQKIVQGSEVVVNEPIQDASNGGEVNVSPKAISFSIDGVNITGRLYEIIMDFKKLGIPHTALVNFWKKLQKNPQHVGKDSLIRFLEKNHVPLLLNGNFLAYKGVNPTDKKDEFASAHDATFIYKLGQPAVLARENCTVDVNKPCGPGLHVGGFEHARGFGNTIIDVEVDPQDVVSVPSSEDSKLRACRLLPVRVNPDQKCYAESYVDLTGKAIKVGAKAKEESVRAVKKPGKKKTTWYCQKGNRLMVQRKIVCPGDGWSATKPAAKVAGKANKAVSIKGAAPMRTWYRLARSGKVDRVRAQQKPAGFSSHKPA